MTTNENAPGLRGAGGAGDERLSGGYVGTRVTDVPEPWATVRAGWVQSGDTMPRPGSLAWCALADDDPVKVAAEQADALGIAGDLRRHGPTVARLLAGDVA